MKKVCIVTTRHISYNPRVLKEADCLYNEGYDVTVVTVNNHAQQRTFDEVLMASRRWTLKTVNFRREVKEEKGTWLFLALKQKMFSFLAKWSFKMGIAERTMNRAFSELTALAAAVQANLYISHHPEALAVGFKAAKINKAKFTFDAEDFHTGMTETISRREVAMIAYLENKYLPSCNFITAGSKGIAEAYAAKYSITEPIVILNVFPKVDIKTKEPVGLVKFYWYSQVIGPNRNLEYLVKAAAAISEPFELHLRGSFHSTEYKNSLDTLLQDYHLVSKVFFHEPILSEEIISDAAKYDVGLALESNVSVNRDICVTNKIFSYLMSGLAIIGTDTYGQKDIFTQFPEACCLCTIKNTASLATAMKHFMNDRKSLHEAKAAARKEALKKFNWESESQVFLACVDAALQGKESRKHNPNLLSTVQNN